MTTIPYSITPTSICVTDYDLLPHHILATPVWTSKKNHTSLPQLEYANSCCLEHICMPTPIQSQPDLD